MVNFSKLIPKDENYTDKQFFSSVILRPWKQHGTRNYRYHEILELVCGFNKTTIFGATT